MAKSRHKKIPSAQPRALQARPTISFRTDRSVLEIIGNLADRFGVTRNDLIDGILKTYLETRGVEVEAMLTKIAGAPDDRQIDIFA